MSYLASRWRFSGLTRPGFGKAARGRGPVDPARRRSRPALEWLEHRLVLSSFTVTDNSDSLADTGSLRYAITQVDASTDASNTITINSSLSGGQTITLGSALPSITKNVAIVGPGADVVSVSGNHACQVFNITAGATVRISGLTVTAGLAQIGGGIANAGTLTLTGTTISGNAALGTGVYASASGGGISNSGTLTVIDSTLTGNDARAVGGTAFAGTGFSTGGAIDSTSTAVLTLTGCTLSKNWASAVGAVYASINITGTARGGGVAANGPVMVTDCDISGNDASGTGGGGGYGGGIYAGTVTVTDSTISGNSVTGVGVIYNEGKGGGIDGTDVTVTRSTITGNSASGVGYSGGNASGSASGGGIHSDGAVTVINCTISGNTVSGSGSPIGSGYGIGSGGGIGAGGTVTVTGSTVTDNKASATGSPDLPYTSSGSLTNAGTGGGISAANVTVTDSTISGNTASGSDKGYGGGLYGDDVEVINSTVSGNTVSNSNEGFGGGLYGTGVEVINSTVAANRASGSGSGSGGGLYAPSGMTLTDSTVSGNSATKFGGGACTIAGPVVFETGNSIIAGNLAPTGPDVNGPGRVLSQGHNLVGNADNMIGWTASDLTGTAAAPLDPMLGPLADNGGPTQTMALLPGSPAIDAGDNGLAIDSSNNPLPYDQRGPGHPRIVNGTVDIGAFELERATQTKVAASSAGSTYGQSVTFTATVSAGGNPETAGTVTFLDGTTVLASGVALDASGQASFSASALPVTSAPHVITAEYSGAGADLPSTGATTETITPARLTVTLVVSSKLYDGTTAATVSGETLAGVLGKDQVGLSGGTATFADKNVGTGKTVDVTGLSLTGVDAGNYRIGGDASATADITPLTLTASVTVSEKTYDGTTAATITGRNLIGVLVSDDVRLTGGTAAFDTKNAGTDKRVTTTGLSLTGADAGNYRFNTVAETAASIAPAVLTPTAVGRDKVYDGTTAATVAFSDDRIAGDAVTLVGSAAFSDPNAGTGKTINISGLGVTGPDASNYRLVGTTATAAASILKANQTIAWSDPADIGQGTALSPMQLNARASGVPGGSAPGTLSYSPPAGTLLPVGMNQPLTVTAAGTANYNPASVTVSINVLSAGQQASALVQEVSALASGGSITLREARALLSKLTLRGRDGGASQISAFLNQVASFSSRGILTQPQASQLASAAEMLRNTLAASSPSRRRGR